MSEINQTHFNYFKDEARKWIKRFGLVNYAVGFNQDAEEEARASCWANVSNGTATISINPEWDIEPTKRELSRAAFHEVVELLFIELSTLAAERFTSDEQLDRARHRIIRTLENVVWDNS